MIRLYCLGLLLPLSIPALAQQTEPLTPRRVGVEVRPDSLPSINYPILSGRLSCPIAGVPIKPYHFTPFFPIQEQLRQVAGLQATPYSGAPGAQVAVRIRGAASFSGNAQPLYVVDGVPVWQHTFRPDGGPGNGLNFVPVEMQELDINPLLSIPTEDIASVEVVKGAYETAPYGAQGVNGVIRITTRRSAGGTPRLTYAGYGGVQRARYRYDLLDAREFATLTNEVEERYGRPPRYSADQVAVLGRGTDWQREVLRTAAVQEHHLGYTGGTAATHYYVAADYLGQEGVVLTSRLRRHAARAALTQRVGQRLRLEASGGVAQITQRIPSPAVAGSALLALPTDAPDAPPASIFSTNPVLLAQTSYQTPTHHRLLGQLSAHYQLATGLMLEARTGLEYAALRSRSYRPAVGSMPAGAAEEITFTYRQLVLNPALRYRRSFRGEQHAVSAALEITHQDSHVTEKQQFLSSGPLPGGPQESQAGSLISAYILTTDYTLARRYQLRGSLRRDASSALAPDNRWQWLPGAQAMWHASEESFLTGTGWQLKLWTGWGRTAGSALLGRNITYLLAPSGNNLAQRIPVVTPDRTTQLDAGLEAGLPNERLTVTVEGYTRRTFRQITTLAGLSDVLATLHNTGLELTARSSWQAGSLRGTSRVAAAFNRNRFEPRTEVAGAALYHRLYENQPLSTFSGRRYLGTDAAGQPSFQDTNGDGRINSLDDQPLGSGLPKQLVSVSQLLTLGRLELQFQADGMFGYQMLNTTLLALDMPEGQYVNSSGRVRQRWTPATPAAEVPVAGTSFRLPSTYVLQSGNHVRLSALNVSYKVWEKAGRSAHLWLGGQNLLVLTRYRGFDPNVSSAGSDNQQAGLDAGAYPVARTLLLGVRATL